MILGIEIAKEKPLSIGYRLDTEIEVEQVEEREYGQGIDIAHKEDWHQLFGLSNIVEFIKDKPSGYFLNVKDDVLYLSKNRKQVGDFKFPLNLKTPINKVVTEGVESSYNKTLGDYMREVLSGNFEVGKCFDYQSDEDFELEIKLEKEKDVMSEYILSNSQIRILHWVPHPEESLELELHISKEEYQLVEQKDFFFAGETFNYLKAEGADIKFLVSYDKGETYIHPVTEQPIDISNIYYKTHPQKLEEGEESSLPKEKRITLLRNQDELKRLWDEAPSVNYMNDPEFIKKVQQHNTVNFAYLLDKKSKMKWMEIAKADEALTTPKFTSYTLEYEKAKEEK